MKRKLSVSAALVLLLIGALITFQITYSYVGYKYQDKLDEITENQLDFSKLAAVDELVRSQYVGSIDETELGDKLLRGYMQGLGDSGCSYLSKEEFSEYVLTGSGERFGIGVNATYLSGSEQMYIYRVFDGSPAAKAGVVPGDVIEAVNGQAVAQIGYTAARAKLYGDEGGSVSLTVKRGEQSVALELSFAAIRVETLSYSMLENSVGYVRIYSVNALTEGEFKAAVDALCAQGAKAMVYDLRNNTGGSFDVVTRMLDYLVSDRPLARTYASKDDVTVVNSTPEHSVSLPSAVIVNSITASSAELFAASLRDNAGALVVGEKTAGDAAILTSVKLADLSGLVITTRYFAPPVSESFHNKGLTCDVEASLAPEHELSLYTISFEEDTQLQAAVAALKK